MVSLRELGVAYLAQIHQFVWEGNQLKIKIEPWESNTRLSVLGIVSCFSNG